MATANRAHRREFWTGEEGGSDPGQISGTIHACGSSVAALRGVDLLAPDSSPRAHARGYNPVIPCGDSSAQRYDLRRESSIVPSINTFSPIFLRALLRTSNIEHSTPNVQPKAGPSPGVLLYFDVGCWTFYVARSILFLENVLICGGRYDRPQHQSGSRLI